MKLVYKKGGGDGALLGSHGSARTWVQVSPLRPPEQRRLGLLLQVLPSTSWVGSTAISAPQWLAHLVKFWPISLLGRKLSTSCQEALGVCVKHSKLISGLLGCVIHLLNDHRREEN